MGSFCRWANWDDFAAGLIAIVIGSAIVLVIAIAIAIVIAIVVAIAIVMMAIVMTTTTMTDAGAADNPPQETEGRGHRAEYKSIPLEN